MRRRILRWVTLFTALAVGALTAACSAPQRLAPPSFDAPAAPAATLPVDRPPSTHAAGPVATSVPSADVSGPRLSPDGPWHLVRSAPGVESRGLVYELLPDLWAYLPLQEDVGNGVTWTLTKADVPLVEAYLQARRVFYLATEANPFRLDDPGWRRWYGDEGQGFAAFLAPRDAAGEVFAREQGVVLRPVVLGEQRTDTTGIVFDCMLDGGVWRRPDGSLGADSVVGVVANGVSTLVSMEGGRWRMGHLAAQPEACA